MKKVIFSIFIILFLPLNILAYSKNVIPGGESIGIKINSDGLIVVGYYKVQNELINKDNIKIGDRIIKISNEFVTSINELSKLINDNMLNSEVDVLLIRNNKSINTKLALKEENNYYKTGLYVKDNVVGIGTLTYIDPISKIYGALGHEILLTETNSRVEVKDGNILISKINSINKSRNGRVGYKNASISFNKKIGTIEKNNTHGIFGNWTSKLPNKSLLEVSSFDEIEKGPASILTVTKNNEIKKYDIKIIDKYQSKKETNKAFSFEIVDKELLKESGGIVQGMSGSPIIQNNKLIGSVTNVVIDNVKLGYGISIITMLEEGDSIRN